MENNLKLEDDHKVDDFQKEVRKILRRLVIATVIIYVALGSLFVIGWIVSSNQQEDLADQANKTQISLDDLYSSNCAFREDLKNRLRLSKQFLIDHPEGIPGLSNESINQSINGQERTIKALSTLICPPEKNDSSQETSQKSK